MRPTANPLLSPHFRLSELTLSQKAVRLALDNTPSAAQLANLERLCTTLLEPMRLALDSPIVISSGFRSRLVNTAVGGSKTSDHLDGRAADLIVPGFAHGDVLALARAVAKMDLPFAQLIYEGTWLHISIAREGAVASHEVLTARFRPGKKTTYLPGLMA